MTDTARIPPRQRILDAADDLFRRVGIRGVGVEAIAEAAGTNKMTLYRHFESKDELIAEWVRGIVERKEAEWDEIAAAHPGDPEAQLVDWSRRVAKKFADMEERGSALGNALAELPEAELAADQFYMLLEGAKACVQCIGLKRVGEHLMMSVDALIRARQRQTAAAPSSGASGSPRPSARATNRRTRSSVLPSWYWCGRSTNRTPIFSSHCTGGSAPISTNAASLG